MSQWQPVETAPEGKAVLVFIPGHEPIMAVGRMEQWVTRKVWVIDESFGFNEDGEITDITHWMPLPEPPQ